MTGFWLFGQKHTSSGLQDFAKTGSKRKARGEAYGEVLISQF
jgi:hypothetical protein